MVAIALNLLGVFEVPLSLAGVGQNLTTGGGGRAAFFTGVLAVLVASPCTAPFMGAALGFALTQSAPAALGVFLALGVGFAAPFSALTLSPRLVGMIPKPGPWMVTFKEFLAFPMFATAIWLTWVLSQQTGPDGVALVLTASLTFAFLVWVAPRLPELVVWALGLAAAAVLFWAAGAIEPAAALTKDKSGMWAPWSAQAVQQARTQGQPILVDFTAAWCVTCLVNERVALDVPETRRLLKQANVVTLKGDWTRRDGAISAELTRFGRAGVPLYLFYPVGGEPVVLPQILTPGLVQEVVTQKPVE
jgi:thiol:disulfide interchange protein DsbD